MNNQDAVQVVLDYIDNHMKFKTSIYNQYYLKKKSYSLWAALEIVELLMDAPLEYPVSTIYSFLYKMQYFVRISKSEIERNIFSRACDTAQEIILLFL